MHFQLDYGTGTGATAKKIPITGKKSFLVVVATVDGEINSGFATSAENQVYGVLQSAGLEGATCRSVYTFDCSDDPTACVCYSVNLGRDVEDVVEENIDIPVDEVQK